MNRLESMDHTLLPISAIAKKLQLPEKYYEQIGAHGAKIGLDLLKDAAFPVRGKLILVTATTPGVIYKNTLIIGSSVSVRRR